MPCRGAGSLRLAYRQGLQLTSVSYWPTMQGKLCTAIFDQHEQRNTLCVRQLIADAIQLFIYFYEWGIYLLSSSFWNKDFINVHNLYTPFGLTACSWWWGMAMLFGRRFAPYASRRGQWRAGQRCQHKLCVIHVHLHLLAPTPSSKTSPCSMLISMTHLIFSTCNICCAHHRLV
jgi:hypothetical protein